MPDNKVNVYFISGLGADKRAFQKIILPEQCTALHLDWIIPFEKETLTNYSLRLAEKIDIRKPFILIGLSFGGMVVSELTQKLHPVKSILISSISNNSQLPWYYKMIGKSGIHKIIPISLLKSANPFTFWAFGTKTKEEKRLLKQILKDTNKIYLRWAIDALISWKNKQKPENLFHIHGTEDRIFPIRFVQADVKIQGGRHFMVLSMAEEVNEILGKEIEGLFQQ